MTPYYEQDGITIYHGDCREVLPSVMADVVMTDPPYGIGWRPPSATGVQEWIDDETFDPSAWLRVGSAHLFWGANYFANKLPPSDSWLTWVKRPIHVDFSRDMRSYSTTELAWSDFGCKCRFIAHTWDGGKRSGEAENRTFCHPAQKPIEVMEWCMKLAPVGSVIDPYMGSGTTLIAAKLAGRRAIGIERVERYCEIAAKRLSQGVLPLEATT